VSALISRAHRKARFIQEKLTRRLPVRRSNAPHGLPGNLIVSLTSYPPRYPTLLPTLKKLLSQTIKADKTILWISEDDFHLLPKDIICLTADGLTINQFACNLRPHNKYFSCARAYPDAFIVTVDDDINYRRDMLSELVSAFNTDEKAVVTHRGREIRWRGDSIESYWEWPLIEVGGGLGDHIFPTGVGGTLYPPGAFTEEALDAGTIQKLCLTNDDIWLFWMTRRAGYTAKMVKHPRIVREWVGSQDVGLWSGENRGANDKIILALWNEYGPPNRQKAQANA
jgi:hypothetical protein